MLLLLLFCVLCDCQVKKDACILCDCQLKENAHDLLYVGYFSISDGNSECTFVDTIEVGMKEMNKTFGQLLFKDD